MLCFLAANTQHAAPTCSELLQIRHCVFLMGPSGCGRSEVIRVLARAITAGCAAPTNPYLQANNKKKVFLCPYCCCRAALLPDVAWAGCELGTWAGWERC